MYLQVPDDQALLFRDSMVVQSVFCDVFGDQLAGKATLQFFVPGDDGSFLEPKGIFLVRAYSVFRWRKHGNPEWYRSEGEQRVHLSLESIKESRNPFLDLMVIGARQRYIAVYVKPGDHQTAHEDELLIEETLFRLGIE